MPLIYISKTVYEKLQKLAKDGGNKPADVKAVIEQLVEEHDSKRNR